MDKDKKTQRLLSIACALICGITVGILVGGESASPGMSAAVIVASGLLSIIFAIWGK